MTVSREYSYYILNSRIRSPMTSRFAYRVAGDLDIAAMNRACQTLVGTHDLLLLPVMLVTELGKEHHQGSLSGKVVRDGDNVVFNIVANAFIRHQIRSTAGALVQVGLRKMSEAELSVCSKRKKSAWQAQHSRHVVCVWRG